MATVSLSAKELIQFKGFNYDTRLTLFIVDVSTKELALQVQSVLSNILGNNQEIKFNNRTIKVQDIGNQELYTSYTTIICNPLNFLNKERFNFIDLYTIMLALRAENGCAWDKVQTHKTIRENAIEEAYELVEAINNEDVNNMIEETGDLFLQSIFHCCIGEDNKEYNTEDAISGICKKLINRHPHVFGDIIATNAKEALNSWDMAKAKEKQYTTYSSKMDKVAKSLSPLMRAKKIQAAAKKANFEFENINDAYKKIYEEVEELKLSNDCEKEVEAGDLLFSVVNVLRMSNIDPDVALIKATEKFIKRFKYVENHCNRDMKEYPIEELDKLWEDAKRCE